MDKRIEGMKVSQITRKFVESVLTEEEKNQSFIEIVNEIRTKTFELDCQSKDDLIKELESVICFLESIGHHYHTSFVNEYEFGIHYKCEKPVVISPITHYQCKWKEELNKSLKEAKELAEYERLKKKFGGKYA